MEKSSKEILDEYYSTLNHQDMGELYDKSKVLLIIQEVKESAESEIEELKERIGEMVENELEQITVLNEQIDSLRRENERLTKLLYLAYFYLY